MYYLVPNVLLINELTYFYKIYIFLKNRLIKMEITKVTTKGQVVIPSHLRKKYKIKSGTGIKFIDEDGNIKLIPITAEMIKSNKGFMGTKGKLLKALMAEKKKEREL